MKTVLTILFINCFALSMFSQTYIDNITIVDVQNNKLIPNQTVVLEDDIIADIQSKGSLKIPFGGTVVDGTGKYLIPGFTDSHVHFFQSGGLYTRPDVLDFRNIHSYEKETDWVKENMEDFLLRYMQMGITSVVDVGATYNFLKMRDTFTSKNIFPNIHMTGPLLTPYVPEAYKNLGNDMPFKLVQSIEDAIKMVREQLPFRPDFIKIWYLVDPDNVEDSARNYQPIVKAIIEEAHRNNLKVAVHAIERIVAQLAVESGADYLVHGVEDEVASDEFINLLKAKDIILSPTLVVVEGYNDTFLRANNFSYHDLTNSNPTAIGSLSDLKHIKDTIYVNEIKQWVNTPSSIAREARFDSLRTINLKRMSDAGVDIVAGTDAGNLGTQHASSFLNELKAMKKSGLTNWQILKSATINSAKLFDNQNSLGSVSIGKKADLVLLNGNPIENLEHLNNISSVVHNGTFIDPKILIKETPLNLVKRQLNAYNARNLEAFLEPYANDVELYIFPDKLVSKGKEKMRKDYLDDFKNQSVHCEVKERIVQGNVIIDKESVFGVEDKTLESTAIYHIENDRIKKVYFILND
ncbi:amidohydrolase family protein [Maribacter stanieri]|uniref:amidohydrolase family protein n=1 Tax=Maribacter stanieri TaxID=440514 RepID=UPI0030DBFA8F